MADEIYDAKRNIPPALILAGAIMTIFYIAATASVLIAVPQKEVTGLQGFTQAIEAVATVLALRTGMLPPTMNFLEADPECDLDVVPNQARAAEVNVALSQSFAFGGLNAVLAFRAWQ